MSRRRPPLRQQADGVVRSHHAALDEPAVPDTLDGDVDNEALWAPPIASTAAQTATPVPDPVPPVAAIPCDFDACASAAGGRLLSIPMAAERLGISAETLRRKIAAGEIPTRRHGKRIAVRQDDVEDLLIQRMLKRLPKRRDVRRGVMPDPIDRD